MKPPTHLSEENRTRLQALEEGLAVLRRGMLYVDYRQAERDCERLAAQILQRWSRQELRSWSFTPIPRGGLILLGMLAYALDLQPTQLALGGERRGPVAVVDDCSLTGARFRQFCSSMPQAEFVFVHLYSHPNLREALLRSEPRLKYCLAVQDLVDHAPTYLESTEAYESWLARRRERAGPDEVWHGMPDLVCFAWSEPGTVFWNPVRERLEGGWRFFPPHLCLKNRAQLAAPSLRPGRARWQVPRAVATGLFDGVLWLHHEETGQVYALEGTAADMWRAIAAYGDPDVAVEYLLSRYVAEADILRRDLDTMVEGLERAGLLEPVPGTSGDP